MRQRRGDRSSVQCNGFVAACSECASCSQLLLLLLVCTVEREVGGGGVAQARSAAGGMQRDEAACMACSSRSRARIATSRAHHSTQSHHDGDTRHAITLSPHTRSSGGQALAGRRRSASARSSSWSRLHGRCSQVEIFLFLRIRLYWRESISIRLTCVLATRDEPQRHAGLSGRAPPPVASSRRRFTPPA